ncbi:murein transglycosylase A [Labrys sedimenti]|uniref:murein transglycosylase A n=1 Tax=Labrys sedimenti TaxID=3106036 RepID=UPI002ACA177C|nr:MltA domain-containing protein [Labrys sp. ZIDIC5]MDZ5449302.1 MltA domain-containing protein [Labrys sp. ZIDIC5]
MGILRRVGPFAAFFVAAGIAWAGERPSPPPLPAGATATLVPFGKLAGWKRDDHAKAWQVWLASCRSQAENNPALDAGVPVPEGLASLCREALKRGALEAPAARAFFQAHFDAWRITTRKGSGPTGGKAFYTGYYEPEIRGSLVREGEYQTPLYDRPADLVSFEPNAIPPGFEGYSAARRKLDGSLEVYPDRKAIEQGALDGRGLEIAYVADPVDRFFMQVQGSGRLRLPTGSVVRFAYAGKNGQPYSAIGRAVAERLNIPPRDVTMAGLRDFLARDPKEAREVMWVNKSFVFFKVAPFLGADAGPIGGEGLPVTPLRSIAIDRRIWPYGLPVFVETAIPNVGGGVKPEPIRKLMIAQDTGSAIIGPARADIFFGSGAKAGAVAGAVRHGGGFYVLWPKSQPGKNGGAGGRP